MARVRDAEDLLQYPMGRGSGLIAQSLWRGRQGEKRHSDELGVHGEGILADCNGTIFPRRETIRPRSGCQWNTCAERAKIIRALEDPTLMAKAWDEPAAVDVRPATN
jgi:hypothetical protein